MGTRTPVHHVDYTRDWECDGAIRVTNPETQGLYAQWRSFPMPDSIEDIEAWAEWRTVKYNLFLRVRDEVNPQEAYLWEYNNYECMYACDGDAEAVVQVIRIWGKDTASRLERIRDYYTIEEIIRRYQATEITDY